MKILVVVMLFAVYGLAQQSSVLHEACGPLQVNFDTNSSTNRPPAQPEPGKALVYVVEDLPTVGALELPHSRSVSTAPGWERPMAVRILYSRSIPASITCASDGNLIWRGSPGLFPSRGSRPNQIKPTISVRAPHRPLLHPRYTLILIPSIRTKGSTW